MDFESPEAMKEFPGLYAADLNRKSNNESDYSDDADKSIKKDSLIKRKDKKDKKDKDRGYAALEGESSPDESEAKSPSKSKKSKSFKFTTKHKDKREKSREKDLVEKKKEKKGDKKGEKDKSKAEKKDKKAKNSSCLDIAEHLPIFGVPLKIAVERSRCHDGIDLPLPVRMAINFIEEFGLSFEGIYKVSGAKSKVAYIKKMFNNRENVVLNECEVPTITSFLKMFLRDLPEAVFTNELLIRFEEAGAILNTMTREKHLRILIDNLPVYNRILLQWLLIHFDNVINHERVNKMNTQTLVQALSPTLRTSHRLLTALLYHCRSLFPNTILSTYKPPLSSGAQLPNDLESLEKELLKQESLLSQIHQEMNEGIFIRPRQELLWEVQRMITQLKRKIKNIQKENAQEQRKLNAEEPKQLEQSSQDDKNTIEKVAQEKNAIEKIVLEKQASEKPVLEKNAPEQKTPERNALEKNTPEKTAPEYLDKNIPILAKPNVNLSPSRLSIEKLPTQEKKLQKTPTTKRKLGSTQNTHSEDSTNTELDDEIILLQMKVIGLIDLRDRLTKEIEQERGEIISLKKQLKPESKIIPQDVNFKTMDEIMDLIYKENQILQIKKIDLVRKIMEQREICIDLKAQLELGDFLGNII